MLLSQKHFTNIRNPNHIRKHFFIFFYSVETVLFPHSFRIIVSKNFTNIVNFEDIRKHFFYLVETILFPYYRHPVVKLTLQIYEISTYDPSTMLFFFTLWGCGGPRGKIRNLPLISKHFILIPSKIVLVYVVEIVYICTVIETRRGGGAITCKPPPLGRATQCRGVSFSIGPRIF